MIEFIFRLPLPVRRRACKSANDFLLANKDMLICCKVVWKYNKNVDNALNILVNSIMYPHIHTWASSSSKRSTSALNMWAILTICFPWVCKILINYKQYGHHITPLHRIKIITIIRMQRNCMKGNSPVYFVQLQLIPILHLDHTLIFVVVWKLKQCLARFHLNRSWNILLAPTVKMTLITNKGQC